MGESNMENTEEYDFGMILDKLSVIIKDCSELEFSFGKWSKIWLKIKFRRIEKHE